MTAESDVVGQSAEELFEHAPCGYLATELDGTLIRVNETFERWTGLQRADLIGRVRFPELLSPGGRIYHETHLHPLLMMQGSVREIALDLRRADGSLLPMLVNAVLHRDSDGRPRFIRTIVFDATDRRRYEQELLDARRREHDIAQRLQLSMLGGELPTGEGFELEVFYAPAVDTLEIGGDWFDAFWVGERTLGLVVGDVVGRGIEAAATMGQLRSAVRALASTGLPPGPLLEAMDGFARRHGTGQTATLVYAQLGLDDGSLRLACAGHVPPVLLEPAAPARFSWAGRSWPLDTPAPPSSRPEAHCTVPPGGTLVLYTDGLVEHRARPIEEGMERLLEVLAQRCDAPVAELIPAVAEEVGVTPRSDDVCVLGVRVGTAE